MHPDRFQTGERVSVRVIQGFDHWSRKYVFVTYEDNDRTAILLHADPKSTFFGCYVRYALHKIRKLP